MDVVHSVQSSMKTPEQTGAQKNYMKQATKEGRQPIQRSRNPQWSIVLVVSFHKAVQTIADTERKRSNHISSLKQDWNKARLLQQQLLVKEKREKRLSQDQNKVVCFHEAVPTIVYHRTVPTVIVVLSQGGHSVQSLLQCTCYMCAYPYEWFKAAYTIHVCFQLSLGFFPLAFSCFKVRAFSFHTN